MSENVIWQQLFMLLWTAEDARAAVNMPLSGESNMQDPIHPVPNAIDGMGLLRHTPKTCYNKPKPSRKWLGLLFDLG